MKTNVLSRFVIAFAVIALSALPALAQITVTGTVTDKTGEPLIGASVLVVGTQNGSATDLNGNFTLKNVAEGALIRASYVTYKEQEQRAASKMHFVLEENSELLDEVVVVGYGSMKKSNLSGAVASVKADDLPSAGNASVGEMLRGRAAGMNITSSTAAPGGQMNIAIRGGLSGQQPLVVIDGVPQAPHSKVSAGTIYSGAAKDNSGLINLNPNDIESIDVLKDASAAAIYGSDASGGVILITTKRGKEGRPEISYSGSVAFSRIKDAPDFMDARQFMITQNQVFEELGRGDEKKFTQSQIDNFVGEGTDWMKEVTRTGVVNEHNLSVTAGGKSTKTLFSLSYYNHQGLVKNNSMNRITGRLNVDQDFGKYIKGGINSSFSQIKYNDVPTGDSRQEKSAVLYSAMTFIPTVPVRDANGDFSVNPIRDMYPNPVSLLDIYDKTTAKNLYASGYLEYKPWSFFNIRATAGVDISWTQADQYTPTTTKHGFSLNGEASKQNANSQMNLVNVIANFNKTFADKHDVSVMAGWEYKKQSWDGMGIVARDFPFDTPLMNNIGSSQQEKPTISSYRGTNEMASWIGRVNYTLLDRYILTANLRIDGSSNFSEEHQWGAFPGFSAAWKINEEAWLREQTWLTTLKLRGGWGQTGNAGNLTGINTFYSVMQGAWAPGGSPVNGVALSKIGNPNLKWETLTDINIGLDAGFFNNRLQVSVDAYQRTRSDVILSKQLMSYHEVTTIDYNSREKYRSRGIDIGIHSINIAGRDFSWSTDLNLSFYKNQTISRDPDFIPAAYQPMVQDWGDIYGWRTDGLVQQGETYAHLPNSGAGAIKYLDLNGYMLDEKGERMRDADGRYILSGEPDGLLDEADYVALYNSTPIPFSINNTLTWKNWDANIYIYGSLRGRKINDVKHQSVYGLEDITYGVNALTDVMNRWRPDYQEGSMPGVAEAKSGFAPSKSDFFYENAWYLRIDNISVGYTFPAKWFNDKVKNLRLYGAVRNIGVITPYKGMDPETGNGIGAYPNNFQVAVGVDLKF
ncbi:TonB-dependent receptor [uncultured Bacteroides sp.]|jgi:tonB-linked outer membrane protein, susC/ragA family|uniref:SusC/RagA family TonB-linked outer membrane protein n=1 Tax=uncultured Bacteroides sp. TaxID=162156 RepID=UPI00280C0B8B|nr:TonB-dependent receptor [uncultured Bacteroides sp.]